MAKKGKPKRKDRDKKKSLSCTESKTVDPAIQKKVIAILKKRGFPQYQD